MTNEWGSTMIESIEFVMKFYNISWNDAINFYWDEVEAYMQLSQGEIDE